MTLTTLDIIVRRILLTKRYPIHWYMEYLNYTSACLRELNIDTLTVVNTVQLMTDGNGSANLPEGFSDDVLVSKTGGRLNSFYRQSNISPVRNHNATTGQYEANSNTISQTNTTYPIGYGAGLFYNTNDYFENTGGVFGGVGKSQRGYSIIRQQRRIQFSEGCTNMGFVMVFVSDGQSVDSASQIDIKAINCIESWVNWYASEYAGVKGNAYSNTFYSNKDALRARLSDIESVEDLLNVIRGTYKATAKG